MLKILSALLISKYLMLSLCVNFLGFSKLYLRKENDIIYLSPGIKYLGLWTNLNLEISEGIGDTFDLNCQPVSLGKGCFKSSTAAAAFILSGIGGNLTYKWKLAIYLVTDGFKNVTAVLTCSSFLNSFPSLEPGDSENPLYLDYGGRENSPSAWAIQYGI